MHHTHASLYWLNTHSPPSSSLIQHLSPDDLSSKCCDTHRPVRHKTHRKFLHPSSFCVPLVRVKCARTCACVHDCVSMCARVRVCGRGRLCECRALSGQDGDACLRSIATLCAALRSSGKALPRSLPAGPIMLHVEQAHLQISDERGHLHVIVVRLPVCHGGRSY